MLNAVFVDPPAMKLIHLAFAITFILIGLTAFVAWQAHIEARGARREVEMFRQQQNDQLAAGATPAPSILQPFKPNQPATSATEPATVSSTAGIPSSATPRLASPAAVSISPPPAATPTIAANVQASPTATLVTPPPLSADGESTLPPRASMSTEVPMPKSAAAAATAVTTPSAENIASQAPAPLTPDQRHLMTLPSIAKIKQSFAEDGFVLIDAGSGKSLSAGMKFNVRRGASVVGRLTLTDSIEVEEAIADIQPSSVPAGIDLRAGDELVQIVTTP
jgi:hypothetical protein